MGVEKRHRARKRKPPKPHFPQIKFKVYTVLDENTFHLYGHIVGQVVSQSREWDDNWRERPGSLEALCHSSSPRE